jgi:outer membrane murein-binding lipoprotein Lpp
VRVISFLSGCNPNQNYIFSFPVYLPSCLKEPEPTVYRLYLDEKKEAYDHPVNELNRKIHTISEKLLANRQAFDAHKEDLEALSDFNKKCQALRAKVGACESEIERLRSEKKASFSKEP